MLWGLGTAMAQQAPATPAAGTQATATATPAVSPLDVLLPADPVQRLELASKVNGLEAADIHPWHLKASYEIQDPEGKPLDKGTFEEWWAGPKRYKVIYQGQSFSQTEYGTEKGVFREGNTQIPPFMLDALRNTLGRPVTPLSRIHLKDEVVTDLERQIGPLRLQCISVGEKKRNRFQPQADLYCFESPKAVLRYMTDHSNDEQFVFNNESIFGGRYVPREFVLFIEGQPILSVHVNALEPVETTDPVFAAAPADAVLAKDPAPISGPVTGPRLVSRVFPQYPLDAKAMGIVGTVVMTGRITTEGRVTNIQVWAGPKRLRAAAVDAVRQWRYTPALADGEPVEVDTFLNVIFTLR